MNIGDFNITNEGKTFIIAELSANHNQNKEIAFQTIRAAKLAGADAIKFQTYTPDTLTIDCDNEFFKIGHGTLWDGKTLYQLYQEAFTPWEWHEELFEVAKNEGLVCFSSPFDKSAVDLLESLNTPAYKIASFEIQDIPLIDYVASKQKPIIISTGIATFQDISLAIETCRAVGNNDIILLKCTSAYPATVDLANLKTMVDFKEKFNVIVGVSDHTIGHLVPTVSTALGGKVIEKHFILDKALGGPDAEFSLNPSEFREMVTQIRETEKALGKITYEVAEKVKKNQKFARSLFVVTNINEGEIFSEDNVKSIRPGYGLHPKYLKDIIGKKAKRQLERGTPLSTKDIL